MSGFLDFDGKRSFLWLLAGSGFGAHGDLLSVVGFVDRVAEGIGFRGSLGSEDMRNVLSISCGRRKLPQLHRHVRRTRSLW
jgi:hypothetical protein